MSGSPAPGRPGADGHRGRRPPPRRRRQYRRRRLGVLAAAAAVVVLGLVGWLGPGLGGHPGPTPTAGDAPPSRPGPPPTQAPPTTPPHGGPAGAATVGTVTLPFVDTSRSAELPGPSGGLQAQPRPLPTTVLYPARGSGGVVAGATPLPGPRPLIVFAHGYDAAPARYGALLDAWARAGFVVAAPVFPLTSSRSARLDESDIVNQPGDVSFVISSLLARDHGAGPLAGLINPGAIGVAGHSDGGETVAALSFDSAAQDPRVKATVVMAGAELHLGGGSYFTAGDPPVLVIQGTADRINDPALSTQLYDADPGPKYLLQLPGAGHWAPYTGTGAAAQVVTATTTAFFKAELLGDPRARSQIVPDGQVAGVATIASANVG